jgi:hypothetical protein
MHVYHLRSITTNVTGSLGSEYGLVTIALVLASKCKYCLLSSCHQMEGFYFQLITTGVLDNCTNPNKTCTNMSYGLFPSANGWDEWLKNLVRYWEYYGRVLGKNVCPREILKECWIGTNKNQLPLTSLNT